MLEWMDAASRQRQAGYDLFTEVAELDQTLQDLHVQELAPFEQAVESARAALADLQTQQARVEARRASLESRIAELVTEAPGELQLAETGSDEAERHAVPGRSRWSSADRDMAHS